jgi:hypothetical protein
MTGSTSSALHRHGRHVHSHLHGQAHRHLVRPRLSVPVAQTSASREHHEHGGGHHSHGLVDPSIMRLRAGVLADLIRNAGDALTAIPVGAAFLLRSERAERWAGYAVVLAIFVSACVALFETVQRFIHPEEL